MLYARLAAPSKTIGADHLEIFSNVIHLLFFKVCDDDINFIASSIVHAAQEHKFWELNYDSLRLEDLEHERSHTIVNTTGIIDSFLSCME